MADDYTVLNLGTGGDALDEEGVTFGIAPTTRKRARVRVAGGLAGELQDVKNAQPASNAYGAVVREVNADILLSALRDAIVKTGGTSKTLADVVAALTGMSVTVSNFPATPDVSDRAARLVGHVTVDAAPTTAVTGTFWQATQPVSVAALPALAAGTAVIGHVVVDNAGALTDRSGTITAGGAAQNAVGTNATRRYLLVRNPKSATESLWLSLVGTAAAASPSLELAAGDAFVAEHNLIPTNAVSVFALTTGHAFTVWEG
jgi:hypothetical protein